MSNNVVGSHREYISGTFSAVHRKYGAETLHWDFLSQAASSPNRDHPFHGSQANAMHVLNGKQSNHIHREQFKR